MAYPPRQFGFTYDDLERITGLTKSGVSQHVCRGNLDPSDLVSVCAFIARYGKPEVRLEIMEKMMGIDRQTVERRRPQSTIGIMRDELGRVAEESPKYKLPSEPVTAPKASGSRTKKAASGGKQRK
jgi:hypothetical protein